MSGDQVNRTKYGSESPADLLRRAARFRQHAQHFAEDPIGPNLERCADGLEARAHQIKQMIKLSKSLLLLDDSARCWRSYDA
jgi:hypothetical protein